MTFRLLEFLCISIKSSLIFLGLKLKLDLFFVCIMLVYLSDSISLESNFCEAMELSIPLSAVGLLKIPLKGLL